MEDRDIRIENYLNTIEAMSERISHLKEEFTEINTRILNKISIPNGKFLDSKISQSQNKIHQLGQELKAERDVFRKLTAESKIMQKNEDFEYVLFRNENMIERLRALTVENQTLNQRQKELEFHNSKSTSDIMRVLNPKLHFLMKKAIQFEDQNSLYRNLIAETDDDRTKTNSIYSKITHALNMDDKTRQKVKDLEDYIQNKTIFLRKLEGKLLSKQYELRETEFEVENSEENLLSEAVENLKFDKNEVLIKREGLLEELRVIDTEISQEKVKANVLSAREAICKLKDEAKRLETEIVESNKILKIKDRELINLKDLYHKIPKKSKAKLPRPSSQLSSPRISEYKITAISGFSTTQQSFASQMASSDPRRNTLIKKLHKEGVSKEVVKALKTVGKPNQSMGSKIVELNRGLFMNRISSSGSLKNLNNI